MVLFLCIFFPSILYMGILYFYKIKFKGLKSFVHYIINVFVVNFSIFIILALLNRLTALNQEAFHSIFAVKYMALGIAFAIVYALMKIFLSIRFEKEPAPEIVKKGLWKRIVLSIAVIAILIISFVLILGSNWLVRTFGLLSPDKILFHLKVPLKGSNSDFLQDFIFNILSVCLAFSILIFIIMILVKRKNIQVWIVLTTKKMTKKINKGLHQLVLIGVSIFLVISFIYAFNRLELQSYIKFMMSSSNFIEENYVDPRTVTLEFPEKKRNIIYIYLESMENTYTFIEDGGVMEENYIPELTSLAKEHISFSNTEELGGALSIPGTGWTVAAMVAQTSGLPLKVPVNGNSYGEDYEYFLPGIYSLGNILEEEGYQQYLMVGSDATFGGRSYYFEQHGNYKIYDYYTAKTDEIIEEDYEVWWGFEDIKLYDYAKQELLAISQEDAPFNFTLLTVDTHHIGGYLCEECEEIYDQQFSNVLACSSKQVSDFITWIQEQDFYENTTIVLAGDHLSMDGEYFENISDDYIRTTYNAFINSAVTTDDVKNREFSVIDLFPSTLASMGVRIEGERLGLGTNLFSNTSTLIEEYGSDVVIDELNKNSEFYNNQFIFEKGKNN